MKTLIMYIYTNERINKLLLFLVFVFSLLMGLSVFKHNITSNNLYYFTFAISFVLFIIPFIFLIAKYKRRLEYLFVIIMIPLGLGYLIFMLPGYVPDEPSHIAKAYTLSELDIFNDKDSSDYPIMKLPLQLEGNSISDINDYKDIDFILGTKTNYSQKIRTISNTAAGYFPLMYLIPSLGLGLGRILNFNIFAGIYLAQAFNLIFFVLTGFFVIRKIPFGKLVMFAYLLTPMMLQQAVSCSADTFLNCCVLLFVSYTLFLKYTDNIKRINWKQGLILGLLMIFISCSKIVYLPICLLIFLLNKKIKNSPKNTKIIIAISLVLSLILSVVFFLYSSVYSLHLDYKEENNVDVAMQLKNVLLNPVTYLFTLFNTLGLKQEMYISTFIGQNLGWFNIPGSYFSTLLFVILLFIAPFLEKTKYFFSKKEKILINILVLIVFNFILGAMYLTWTSVGANVIEGVQGRYFIPIIFLTLLTLVTKNKCVEFKNVNIIYFVLILLINTNSLYSIYLFFR